MSRRVCVNARVSVTKRAGTVRGECKCVYTLTLYMIALGDMGPLTLVDFFFSWVNVLGIRLQCSLWFRWLVAVWCIWLKGQNGPKREEASWWPSFKRSRCHCDVRRTVMTRPKSSERLREMWRLKREPQTIHSFPQSFPVEQRRNFTSVYLSCSSSVTLKTSYSDGVVLCNPVLNWH